MLEDDQQTPQVDVRLNAHMSVWAGVRKAAGTEVQKAEGREVGKVAGMEVR
jgi:hypothetical protein